MSEQPTHTEGIEKAQAIADEFNFSLTELTRFAGQHLAETSSYSTDQIGDSDARVHLAHLGNFEPQVLRAYAEQRAQFHAMMNDSP